MNRSISTSCKEVNGDVLILLNHQAMNERLNAEGYTLMERKSRMPQIQGVQRRSRSHLLRAFGNAGDGVSSVFLKGGESRPLVVILLKKKPTGFFT